MYSVYGQTENGRYLVVFFIYKRDKQALIISARDMTLPERKVYGQFSKLVTNPKRWRPPSLKLRKGGLHLQNKIRF